VQFPAILYWIWLSLRARSFVFFTASNPGIPMGGMFGESKYEILKKIPSRLVPRTILIHPDLSANAVKHCLEAAGLTLPLIFKPDIGERGYRVMRIDNDNDITEYLLTTRTAFLAQELVTEKLEFGVFYMRMPHEEHGRVISVVGKEMLFVEGNGRSTLQELINKTDRAKLQWKRLKVSFRDKLTWIVPAGRRVELVSIGNHALGTRFIDMNHLINERLSEAFDKISINIPGFYFGRYDLRCASLEDLYNGNVRIMELNGCGAEPVHIYDTEFSLWKAMTVLIKHWEYIFLIATTNQRNGVSYMSHREAFGYYKKFKSAVN
jgi:hypothetical protein